MPILRQIGLILGLVFALLAAPAQAVTYPPVPEGPVLDSADILPADAEAALDAKLRGYTQRTGRAVIVATVNSLEGETIEMYAVKLFEAWGIGGKESDSGLLLLIAPTERKLRIETGYGLHGYFPDVLAGRIIRDTITPRFKAGDMPGGINAGVDAIIAQLDRSPEDAKAVAEAAEAARKNASGNEAGAGSVIFWLFLIIIFIAIFGRRQRGYSRSGIDPGVILWGVSEIMRHSSSNDSWGGGSDGGFGGGGFGGFGGGSSGGGGASGSW